MERKIVRDHELAGKRPIIGANAGHIAGVEIAENVLAHAFHRRWLDKDKQTAVAGQIRALNGGSKFLPQLLESVASDHVTVPSHRIVFRPVRAVPLRASGSSV